MVRAGRHVRRWAAYAALGVVVALVASGSRDALANGVGAKPEAQQAGHGSTPLPPSSIQVVQVEPSPKSVAHEASRERGEERIVWFDPEQWAVFLGVISVIFAGALTVVTGFLWNATNKLATSTEDLAKGAEDQVAEMRRGRELAEQQHDLAERQLLLAGRQCDLADKQQAIARLQYYAENRPKLVLKDVYFNMDGLLTFEIANIGGIRATITDGWAAIGHVADERWFKLRSHGEMLKEELAGRQFDVGELKTLTAKHSGSIGLELLGPSRGFGLPDDVFFYGAFHYVDDRGSEFSAMRLTVFRRQWDPGRHAFHRTGNADHEYSD